MTATLTAPKTSPTAAELVTAPDIGTPDDPRTELRLERECCSRCGGSGNYSFCTMYGTTCFRCAGRREYLTKRGAAANDYLVSLRSKRVADLVPGDRVKVDGYKGYQTVVAVTPDTTVATYTVDGVQQQQAGLLAVRCKAITLGGKRPDSRLAVQQNPAEHMRTLLAAIAYQGTLTKAGTVRKGATV